MGIEGYAVLDAFQWLECFVISGAGVHFQSVGLPRSSVKGHFSEAGELASVYGSISFTIVDIAGINSM